MKAFKTTTAILLLVVSLLVIGTDNPAFAENTVRIVAADSAASVRIGDRLLLRYRYENVPFKPCVQQLFSPAGVNILRDSPHDHKHHHALMFAVTVDGVNFWEENKAPGRQLHVPDIDAKAEQHNGSSWASLSEHLHWLNPRTEELLLKEQRTLKVRQLASPQATLLSWQSRLELPDGKESATLTGSHYHGLGMRFVKSMDTGGRFTNADGKPGVVFRGEERLLRSTWCAYTSKVEGKPVTVAMFDHPDNPRHPATWFTMTKPFAYLSATLNLHKEPLKLTPEKPLLLRYAVAIWDGPVEASQIDELYKHWTAKHK